MPSSALVWIFVAFLAMDYLRPHAIQSLRLQMVFILVLPILWLANGRRVWTTNLTLQACFFATGAMMLPFARNNYEVFLNTRVMFAYLVTAIATVWLMGSCRRYFYRVEWSFIAVMCVQAVYAITHEGTGYGEFLHDENDLALACNMVFPFGLVGFQLLEGRLRWICGFVAALMLLATAVSFSRGGFVGLLVASAYTMLMGRNRIRNFSLAAVAGLVLFALAPSSYKGEMESIKETESGTAETRLFMWVTATRMWMDYPIFGVGPYNAKYRVGEYQPTFTQGQLFEATEFHNKDWSGIAIHSLYFELLAERGLVGIGLVAAIAVLHFRTMRRVRRAAQDGVIPANRKRDALFLSLALEASMAGFLASGAFLSMATYPHFWFLSAQGSALERWMKSERRRRAPSPSRTPEPAPPRAARGPAYAAIALCAVALFQSEASAAPPEKRCVELGKGCHCAEALDFDAVVPVAQFFDPPDSTSKECTQAGTPPPWLPVFLRLGGRGVVPGKDGAPPLPAGATTKHVLREKGSGGADSIMTLLANDGSGGRLDLTDKTLCLRGYVSYSEDHPVPGNIKIARVGTARSGLAWQSNWGGRQATSDDGSGVHNPPMVSFISDFQGDGKPDVDCNLASRQSEQPLTYGDCRGHWCRYEICADHTPAKPPQVRARWTQVGGTASLLQGPELANCVYRVPIVDRLYVNEQLMVMDLHGEQLKGSEADGARYLSHALITFTPYDPSFWPGPARELEGR